MSLHCKDQIETKREAIHIAVFALVTNYLEGMFEDRKNEELLFHYVESINELVREYKRDRTNN